MTSNTPIERSTVCKLCTERVIEKLIATGVAGTVAVWMFICRKCGT